MNRQQLEDARKETQAIMDNFNGGDNGENTENTEQDRQLETDLDTQEVKEESKEEKIATAEKQEQSLNVMEMVAKVMRDSVREEFQHEHTQKLSEYDNQIEELQRKISAMEAAAPVRAEDDPYASYEQIVAETKELSPETHMVMEAYAKLIQRDLDLKQSAKYQNVEERVTKTDDDRFKDAVTLAVPNWESIIKDRNFMEFLNTEDENTGVIYRDVFNSHANNRNVSKVKRIFDTYTSRQPIPKGDVAPSIGNQTATDKLNKADYVSPKTAHATDSNAAVKEHGKPTFTQSQVHEMLKEAHRKGGSTLTKVMTELSKAETEGRII